MYPANGFDGEAVAQLRRIADALEQLLASRPSSRRERAREGGASRGLLARNFIQLQLRVHGPLSWAQLSRLGVEAGYSDSTMRRVRGEVAEIAYVGEQGRRVPVWRLRPEVAREYEESDRMLAALRGDQG